MWYVFKARHTAPQERRAPRHECTRHNDRNTPRARYTVPQHDPNIPRAKRAVCSCSRSVAKAQKQAVRHVRNVLRGNHTARRDQNAQRAKRIVQQQHRNDKKAEYRAPRRRGPNVQRVTHMGQHQHQNVLRTTRKTHRSRNVPRPKHTAHPCPNVKRAT